MKKILFLLIIIFFSSCADEDLIRQRNGNSSINIYIVKDNLLELRDTSVNINLLELEAKPWVKAADIEFYDGSSNTFFLNTEVEKSPYSGRNFVITSGSKRLLLGIFWPMHMSSFPSFPSITPEDGFFGPKDIIPFGTFGNFNSASMIKNSDFVNELISEGIYKQGIAVELISLKRNNPSSLSYTYKVTNIDDENIYILDPDKMGSARFHYFTNGVYLNKGNKYFQPEDLQSTPSETIHSNWYYKLLPGRSVTRTVKSEAYHNLPQGKVNAHFSFPGPASTIKSGQWKKSDGRIWLGYLFTSTEIDLN